MSKVGMVQWARQRLPRGEPLPGDIWYRRHRGFVIFLWVQSIGLVVFGLARGFDGLHVILEGGAVALFALMASIPRTGRKFRSIASTIGLLSSAAIFVHFSGGMIEAHFHFFVMVTLITLYQEWIPFLLSIGYVVIHHGIMGTLEAGSVYNHPAAINQPFKWAVIHGTFILGASIAGLIVWKRNEDLRLRERDRDKLEAERLLQEALQMNDTIIQGLAVATMAHELGEADQAKAAVEDTLEKARTFINGLMSELERKGPIGPGDLVRQPIGADPERWD